MSAAANIFAPHWSAQWLGVPYVRTADESRSGANCWGFFRMVMREQFGREVPVVDVDAPESSQDMAGLRTMLAAWRDPAKYQGWQQVPFAEAKEGDVLLLSRRPGWPDHIGVIVETATAVLVLHCARGLGSVREPLPRVTARWRVAEIWRPVA